MPSSSVSAVIGLANPGNEYAETRHNAGAWFVERLAQRAGATLRPERKFNGAYAKVSIDGHDVHLLVPSTYMNHSGKAVAPLAQFFKLPPEALLVAHDELDIAPGTARFKFSGGHGGHNGLRDIIAALGNSRDFYRLRLGIGHPGSTSQVVNHVLGRPGKRERSAIDEAIDAAADELPQALNGDWERAMQRLHSQSH